VDRIHDKTLVQIFVENRIYKRIEECKTLPDVQRAVTDGVNTFRALLNRDVTQRDVEMLLGIKIKRISLYDINRNRNEITDLEGGVTRVETNLGGLTDYAIRYLRGIRRKYAKDYPRRTTIVAGFDSIAVRELTADELTLSYDRERGYMGHEVAGDPLFQCSSLDKLMVLWNDGRYRVMSPPDKLFVDANMPWCGHADRDRLFVMAYRDEDGLTYVKRFKFGGTILNREYRCIPPRSSIVLCWPEDVRVLYVRYTDGGGHAFDLKTVKTRGVKTLGRLLTTKPVASVHAEKPERWSDRRSGRPRPPLGS
jgi:topoisomerase-4 subunit A